jgi:hypothetical protein
MSEPKAEQIIDSKRAAEKTAKSVFGPKKPYAKNNCTRIRLAGLAGLVELAGLAAKSLH